MVPPEPKFDEAAAAFVAADARFVVIGGFAVIANRFVRATEDVDFLVPDDVDNDRRVLAALRALDGVRMRDEVPLADEHLLGRAHPLTMALSSRSPACAASSDSSALRGGRATGTT